MAPSVPRVSKPGKFGAGKRRPRASNHIDEGPGKILMPCLGQIGSQFRMPDQVRRLPRPGDERRQHPRPGAPGDVEARHRVPVPVGQVTAPLGPGHQREPAHSHLVQPGALLPGGEVALSLRPPVRSRRDQRGSGPGPGRPPRAPCRVDEQHVGARSCRIPQAAEHRVDPGLREPQQVTCRRQHHALEAGPAIRAAAQPEISSTGLDDCWRAEDRRPGAEPTVLSRTCSSKSTRIDTGGPTSPSSRRSS
jgi:hypothetical protein